MGTATRNGDPVGRSRQILSIKRIFATTKFPKRMKLFLPITAFYIKKSGLFYHKVKAAIVCLVLTVVSWTRGAFLLVTVQSLPGKQELVPFLDRGAQEL